MTFDNTKYFMCSVGASTNDSIQEVGTDRRILHEYMVVFENLPKLGVMSTFVLCVAHDDIVLTLLRMRIICICICQMIFLSVW